MIVNEPPSGLGHLIAYDFANKHHVAYLAVADPRLDTTIIDVYDNKFTCSKYKKTFGQLVNGDMSEKEKEHAQNFIKKFKAVML